jgi:hypothetical protein
MLLVVGLVFALRNSRLSPEEARKELRRIGIEDSEEAFMESASKGNTHAVQLFLAAGMDPNATTEVG